MKAVPTPTRVKSRLIFCHGFAEDERLYLRFFDDLCEAGYEVFYYDQRGSGETSMGKDKGHTNENFVFDDLDFFIEKNLREIGDSRLFLGGHSMGGGIALNYGVHGRYRLRLRGIFVTSPLVKVHSSSFPSPIILGMIKAVGKVYPTFKFKSNQVPEKSTHDQQWQEFVVSSPLSQPVLGTLGQLRAMLVRGTHLLKPDYASKFDSTPLIIVQGNDDKIVDPRGTKTFFKLAKVDDKEAHFLPHCFHDCLIEEMKKYIEVRDLLIRFLDSH